MAKKNLVAKVVFDDGTKKGENGKPVDYKVGDDYVGTGGDLKAAMAKGLVCDNAELMASKEVVDEKDRTIRSLETKLAKALEHNGELQREIDELSAAQPGRKSRKAANEGADEEQE